MTASLLAINMIVCITVIEKCLADTRPSEKDMMMEKH